MVDLCMEVAEMMDDKRDREGENEGTRRQYKSVSLSVSSEAGKCSGVFRIKAHAIVPTKVGELKWSSYPNGSTLISCPGHSVSTISSILLMSRVLR